ncbi:MAG: hypothetical protein WCB68_02550 [Pyrinomonadaceae bacterium]
MEQRRKIVIQTGTEPIEEPHFDAEATLSARPVVPLAESAVRESYESVQPYAVPVSSITRRSPWLLALLIAAAALAGAAGALAIDYLRSREPKEATVTAQPSATTATVAQPVAKPAEELKASDKVSKDAQPPVVNSVDEKAPEKTAPVSTANAIEKKPEPESQPKASAATPKEEPSRKETKETAKSAKPRDKSEDERADNERERKQQRREQRRARIVDEYKPEDLPAGNRRAKEGVTRIRDIFEGRRP